MKNFDSVFRSFKGVDAVLLTREPTTFYLTGYSNDAAYLLLTHCGTFYYTDTRYTEEASSILLDKAEVIAVTSKNVYDVISEKLLGLNVKTLGFEGEISYNEYKMFSDSFKGVSLVAIDDVLCGLRAVKDKHEISLIKKAASINDKAFIKMLKKVKEGITEKALKAELEYQMKKFGADGFAFDTIVAFGTNTSKPHAHTGDTKLEKGMPITIDFGCKYKGYCSDITRTFVFGEPTDEFKEIYNEVLNSNLKGIEKVRAGIVASDVDNASRGYLKNVGLDKLFIHGTGHGVGVEIHEAPTLNPLGNIILKKNMVVTVEPGVYLEGRFGIRIEDLILVTDDGCEVLSRLDKKLLIL